MDLWVDSDVSDKRKLVQPVSEVEAPARPRGVRTQKTAGHIFVVFENFKYQFYWRKKLWPWRDRHPSICLGRPTFQPPSPQIKFQTRCVFSWLFVPAKARNDPHSRSLLFLLLFTFNSKSRRAGSCSCLQEVKPNLLFPLELPGDASFRVHFLPLGWYKMDLQCFLKSVDEPFSR
jgi:hypothetical protein